MYWIYVAVALQIKNNRFLVYIKSLSKPYGQCFDSFYLEKPFYSNTLTFLISFMALLFEGTFEYHFLWLKHCF